MLLARPCAGCRRSGSYRRSETGAFCRSCQAAARLVGVISGLTGLDGAGALFHYEGVVQRAIVTAKSGARPDVFRFFASEFAELIAMVGEDSAPDSRWSPDIVTWVPASKQGRSERGYDQGRLMAATVGRRLGVPVRRLLARGSSGSQLGLGRSERLKGADFRARGVCAGRIALIDDVITTGASMASAAAALRSAGAASVHGLAVAWAASAEELDAGRPLPIGAVSDRKHGTFHSGAASGPGLQFGLRSV